MPTPVGKCDRQTDRQTDMGRPLRCSSLTLEREEHLKNEHKQQTDKRIEIYLKWGVRVYTGFNWLRFRSHGIRHSVSSPSQLQTLKLVSNNFLII
jgi:hypothetical protein